MKKKTAGLIAIVAVAAIAMFAGCIEEPSKEEATLTVSLGETAVVDGVSFTVVKYEFTDKYTTTYNQTEYPSEGAKFLWISVKATDVDEVAHELPDVGVAEDSNIKLFYEGSIIEPDKMGTLTRSKPSAREPYDTPYDPYFEKGKAYPNVTYEGWILFEVPIGFDASQANLFVYFPHTSYKKGLICDLGS